MEPFNMSCPTAALASWWCLSVRRIRGWLPEFVESYADVMPTMTLNVQRVAWRGRHTAKADRMEPM